MDLYRYGNNGSDLLSHSSMKGKGLTPEQQLQQLLRIQASPESQIDKNHLLMTLLETPFAFEVKSFSEFNEFNL